MPYLSRDWRCPGEKWIKSIENGNTWENAKFWREKVFANMNAVALKRIYRQSLTNEKLSVDEFKSLLENVVFYQPHIYLNMNVTREVTITSTITDALIRLDMKSAVHDIRRFNYVCKLVKYLLMHRLHTLSGRSQIYLIELLKVIMNHGSFNQMSIFRELLETLKASLEQHNYEHIGSSQLWNNHWEALKLMSSTLENFDIQKTSTNVALKRQLNSQFHSQPVSTSISAKDEPEDAISAVVPTTLETLPLECLSRILSNVQSPVDLESAARASPSLALVINDDLLWKHLAIMNFTPNQIMSVRYGRASWRADKPVTIKECNWRRAYMRLLRIYGEQQVHSASLGLCEACSCLFWMLLGHTCLRESQPSKVRPLSPEDFVSMFSA
ncbi:unnamed protein product [Schistocephalus solidus]|uniref:F-box domain-containing protein n=1 Tax=Schistocephalus solidus TaxID=70667 RepID=A0A183TK19_SCHSO|nr:unnamed protein product [Schistocephalus solidus]